MTTKIKQAVSEIALKSYRGHVSWVSGNGLFIDFPTMHHAATWASTYEIESAVTVDTSTTFSSTVTVHVTKI